MLIKQTCLEPIPISLHGKAPQKNPGVVKFLCKSIKQVTKNIYFPRNCLNLALFLAIKTYLEQVSSVSRLKQK